MARITRKELKTDKFALEVEHTFSFFEEHRQEIARYGGFALVVVVLAAGFYVYRQHQHTAREAALARALQIQDTPVGTPPAGSTTITMFPTEQVKDDAALKVFSDLRSKYSGSDEAEIAGYYLGGIQAGQGKLADAEKTFREVAEKGNEQYASLAKLSLAEVYFAQGKVDQGRKIFEDLIAHPTLFVSKDQAQIGLARALLPVRPEEARKILEPLKNTSGATAQIALQLYSDLPPQ